MSKCKSHKLPTAMDRQICGESCNSGGETVKFAAGPVTGEEKSEDNGSLVALSPTRFQEPRSARASGRGRRVTSGRLRGSRRVFLTCAFRRQTAHRGGFWASPRCSCAPRCLLAPMARRAMAGRERGDGNSWCDSVSSCGVQRDGRRGAGESASNGNRGRRVGLALVIGSCTMSHLDNIATRQRNSRFRDAVFAVFVALGAIVSIGTMSTVANAASTHVASR